MKKEPYFIFFLFVGCLVSLKAQNRVENYVIEQIQTAIGGKQVDFEELTNVLTEKRDSMDSYLYNLAYVEVGKAMNDAELVMACVDEIFATVGDEQLAGYQGYLLYTKAYGLLQEGEYEKLGDMAEYALNRWKHLPEMEQLALHYRRIADVAKGMGRVSVKRPDRTTSVPLERNMQDQNEMGFLWTITTTLNTKKSSKIIFDTGSPYSITLGNRYAREAGVKLLPDSSVTVPAAWPEWQISLTRGVADSLQIGDIVFYNLPVWVSSEEEFLYSDGLIGSPDLARLDYVELSSNSLTFPYPMPAGQGKPNFHMHEGYTGRGIYVPCKLNNFPYTFCFDTGTNMTSIHTSFASPDGKNEVQMDEQTILFPETVIDEKSPYEGERGLLGQPFVYAFDKISFNFKEMRMTLGNPSNYISATNVLQNGYYYYMRRHAEIYSERQPALYPYIKAYVGANFNQPEEAIEYASLMIDPSNLSMVFAMTMIRQKAHYDRGEYAEAAACSKSGLEFIASLGDLYPESARARLTSLFNMDEALSDQPPMVISIEKPETIKIKESKDGYSFVEGKIGKKKTLIAFNTEEYYNEISLQKAQEYGIRLLTSEMDMNGKKGYIGMVDKLQIGNLLCQHIPFFVYTDDTPLILGLSLLKKLPVMEVFNDGNIKIHPSSPIVFDDEMKFMRSDVALYGEIDTAMDEHTEKQLTNSVVFAPKEYIRLDFRNMMYQGE